MLYIDGKPYAEYNGAHDTDSICNFIIEASRQAQQQKKEYEESIRNSGNDNEQKNTTLAPPVITNDKVNS